MQERIKNRLFPGCAAVLRHNRRNDVHQLREASDFHAVGVAQQRNQHAAHHERVFEGVGVFQQRRRDLPGFLLAVSVIGMKPDIPFVKREVNLFAFALFRFHGVAERNDRFDEFIHIGGFREERADIVGLIAIIGMNRDVINQIVGMFQHRCFPFAECRHL